MAQYFFDTSAAVKYYHAEAGAARVAQIFAEPGRECRISSLGLLEIQSALALKFRLRSFGDRMEFGTCVAAAVPAFTAPWVFHYAGPADGANSCEMWGDWPDLRT